MFNIIGKRYWFFLLSAIVILPGVISLVLFQLKPGPDFAGGTELEVRIPLASATVPLNNLLSSATKTSALPAGKIISKGSSGSTILVQIPVKSAESKLTSWVKATTGTKPATVTLTSTTGCPTVCTYSIVSPATVTSAEQAALSTKLAQQYPASKKVQAGKVVSTTSGSAITVQIPEKGAAGQLQSLMSRSVGISGTTVKSVKSSACPDKCVYSIRTTTTLNSSQIKSFTGDFKQSYAASPAQAGIQPEYVQPVLGTHCPSDCRYYIRSKLLTAGQEAAVAASLAKTFPSKPGQPSTKVLSYLSVGSTVAASTKQNAVIAVAVAALFILCYITFAFRKMPHPIRYGTAAIIAMLHDVLVVLGIFSILGKVLNVEVDATFVTAMLTIIGFSVHDTIVIFDRIRENVSRRTGEGFEAVVNHSVLQSFVRSINTSFTVVLTLGAIFLFSGESIRYFVLAMLIGIISGTYSSIFNASPILVVWETGELGRIFGRKRTETEPPSSSGAGGRVDTAKAATASSRPF